MRLYCEGDDSGAECRFFKIPGRKMGIKAYYDYYEARRAYDLQKRGHRLGVGPAVGQMLIVIDECNFDLWLGFETEIAKYPTKQVWDEQSKSLRAKLRKIGLGGDFRPDNCGEINGKLVLVDFGSCSSFSSGGKVTNWYPKGRDET